MKPDLVASSDQRIAVNFPRTAANDEVAGQGDHLTTTRTDPSPIGFVVVGMALCDPLVDRPHPILFHCPLEELANPQSLPSLVLYSLGHSHCC